MVATAVVQARNSRSVIICMVDARESLGHRRTPVYVRGKTGVVTEIQGLIHDPAALAYHCPGLPQLVWYKLRFRQV